jgi:hypothetical protein
MTLNISLLQSFNTFDSETVSFCPGNKLTLTPLQFMLRKSPSFDDFNYDSLSYLPSRHYSGSHSNGRLYLYIYLYKYELLYSPFPQQPPPTVVVWFL